MKPSRKIYAGVQLRDIRRQNALTQKNFAERLGVSISYLNQMENNHRPVSSAVLLALAQEFQFDISQLSAGEAERITMDLRETLADPVFEGDSPPLADLSLISGNAPALARAFLRLYRGYKEGQERLATLDRALDRTDSSLAPLPWEEVRDFFHYCDNYIDAIDRAAEHFAEHSGMMRPDRGAKVAGWLENHGVEVSLRNDVPMRRYDPSTRHLFLSARSTVATQVFQMAHQVALLQHNELLEATLDLARFRTPEARSICKIGLANYFAGAAILPYQPFLEAARETRHDLEVLRDRFGASFEQVGHRLSTLQRNGAKGIPFFFVRVDQAGTITKRHSATKLQFARFGGSCPLWVVHRAFETPGQFLRQLAETPDGQRYFTLARSVTKPGGGYRAPTQRYAIALGCEVKHAGQLVYSDDMDLGNGAGFEPIGISCRICERDRCHQRALPPLERRVKINPDERDILPYKLG